MRRILVASVLAVLAVTALAYLSRRPLLTALGSFLVVDDPIHPADAIVVLSGSLPDRMLEAVDLYQAKLSPRIILTREPPLPGLAVLRARGGNLPEHHEENLTVGAQLGVPAAAISVIPAPVSSTVAEGQAIVSYLRTQGITSILLVTSKTHARRARMIFRRLAGDRIHITLRPSPYDPFPAADWWHDRAYVRRLVTEYGKLLNYLFIDRWRLHPAADGT